MSFKLDYQVTEGDLVATRWWWNYEPETLLGHDMFGSERIPIINVFRIRDGKIVELWNRRRARRPSNSRKRHYNQLRKSA